MFSGVSGCRRTVSFVLVVLGISVLALRPAHASGADEVILDTAAITQLEQRAESAQFKEQCFLYTEVLHDLTEIAGKQLAAGQDEQVAGTLKHIDVVTSKIQQALAKDAKRLKNAEMLVEHTARRLADMLHITSGDQRVAFQSTLQRVNAVQTSLLGQVFAK